MFCEYNCVFRESNPQKTQSDNIKENAEELTNTSDKTEDVKHRVDVSVFFADAVKHSTDCVCHTTQKQPHKSHHGDCFDCHFGGNHNAPTHTNVATHRKL